MKKEFVWTFVFVLLIAGVFAAVGDNVSSGEAESSGGGTYYTANFYLALVLILLILIIVGFFVWFWIRGPMNKWDK